MALKIYNQPSPDFALSEGGLRLNPLLVTFDGRVGGARAKKLYVRNNHLERYYTSITVSLGDTGDTSIIDGTNDYSWKLYAGDGNPPFEYWDRLDPANTISLDNIGTIDKGDISTYLPFWVRIEVPSNRMVNNTIQVSLTINAQENLVE